MMEEYHISRGILCIAWMIIVVKTHLVSIHVFVERGIYVGMDGVGINARFAAFVAALARNISQIVRVPSLSRVDYP